MQLFIDGDTLFSQEGTTQGDPLAMAMYVAAITPLICIRSLEDEETKQVWFADDATAGGGLTGLRRWRRVLRWPRKCSKELVSLSQKRAKDI